MYIFHGLYLKIIVQFKSLKMYRQQAAYLIIDDEMQKQKADCLPYQTYPHLSLMNIKLGIQLRVAIPRSARARFTRK